MPEPGELTAADRAVLGALEAGFESVGDLIERARFKAALAETMRLASLVNQYVSDEAPWATIAEDRERAGTVLYVVLRCIDNLKILFTPFLPFSSQVLHELLGYDDARRRAALRAGDRGDEAASYPSSPATTPRRRDRGGRASSAGAQPLREPRPLFAKLDPKQVVADELARMERAATAA